MSTSVPILLPLAMCSTPPELDELKMNFRELVKSEDDAMSLLRKHQVLGTHVNCPGKKGLKCGAILKERQHIRFIRVQNRTQCTVKVVLNKYIEPGSVVWTICSTLCR